MRFEFVKLKDNRSGLEYPWILKCTDYKTLGIHNEKYMATTIGNGIEDYFQRPQYHANTRWRGAIQTLAKIQEKTIMDTSIDLENKILNGKIKALQKFGTLYIRENGSYMTHTDTMEVLHITETKEMVYPDYSKSDIQITKFPEGVHFYATIGNMTVTDNNGNQKWNSKPRARKEALKYLETIN